MNALNIYAQTAARALHDEIITLDSHIDTPSKMYKFDIAKKHSYDTTGLRLDIPRLAEGGLDAMFFVVYVPQGALSERAYGKAQSRAGHLFDRIHQTIAKSKDKLEFASSSADFLDIPRRGKHAVFIGVENAYALGHRLENVDSFYMRGARYMTLGHTSNNDVCCSSTDTSVAPDTGLSDFGCGVVDRMNELGMLVDVSHVSDRTFYDVLGRSKVPIVASHSSCRALKWNRRNLTDDMIRALAKKGGVVQICMVRRFLKSGTNVGVADFVDHIEHVAKLVGVDYVGIATDFDGGGGLANFQDATCYPKITEEMLKRNFTTDEIQRIWGGNFMRVLKTAELYSRLLRRGY